MGLGATAFTIAGHAVSWGRVIVTTISLANSYNNYKERKEMQEKINQSPTYSFGPISNTKSHEMPIPIIYGENLVAGNIINQKVRGEEDNYMDLQVGISEGPIEAITEVKANENTINPEIHLGERNQPAWGNNDHGQTFPFVAHYNITLDAEKLEISNVPTLTAIVRGLHVRVWDGNSWLTQYSNNPAWCLMDFLTNKRYGLGIDDKYIDFDTFKEVADYADELVDGEKRFQLDLVIDAKRSALDILTEMLSTFRGFLFYSNGQLKLKADRKEAAVQSFNMDNIVADSFGYSKTSRKERLKEVTVEYTEPDQNYERISARFTDENMPVDTKRTITLMGVNRFSQAGREARYYQKKSKYCTTQATWGAGIDSIQCEVGDVVLLSHDVPGWADKPFRVVQIEEQENDEMVITGIEYNEAIYSDDGVVYQPSTGSTLPNPFEPPASVNNLSLLEQANVLDDGTWIPEIKVTFGKPSSIFWKYANIYFSDDDGATWQFYEKTEYSPSIIRELPPGTYKVRVQSENRRGVKEDFGLAATGQITIHGKDAPPSDVNFGSCEFNDNGIILRLQPVTDIDLDAYEIRTDTNFGNDDASLVYRGDGLEHTKQDINQRQYTFYAKVKDRSGNYSKNADEITLANSAPSAPNFSADDITEFFEAIKIHIPQVSDATGYKVYITPSDGSGNATGDTEVIPLSTADTINHPVESGQSVLIKIGTYDSLTTIMDDENISAEIEATATTIDNIAQFAQDLRPPKIVDEKPTLPDPDFPEGSTITLKTGEGKGKLYVNEAGKWVSKADKAELAVDALMAGTVEAGAIGVDELKSAEAIIQKLGTNELITHHAQIRDAIIDDAKIINVSADKIVSDELLADLIVSRGSINIKGNEKEEVDSLAMMGMGSRKDNEVTNEWDAWKMDQDAIQGYDSNGNPQVALSNLGAIKIADLFDLDANGLMVNTQDFKLDKQGNSTFGGNLEADTVTANSYAEIRNVLPYNYLDSLDSTHPLICDFYIPSETIAIVKVSLSAKGLPFRAYSTGASGGSHSHDVSIPSHNHPLSYNDTGGTNGATSNIISIATDSSSVSIDLGSHSHVVDSHSHGSGTYTADSDSHSHDVAGSSSNASASVSTSGHDHGASMGDVYSAHANVSTGSHDHGSGTYDTDSDTHNHGISGSSGFSMPGTDGVSLSDSASHSHGVNYTENNHNHTYTYLDSMASGGNSTETSTSEAHTHSLTFGIYEDTKPADVTLDIDNGSGFNNTITLNTAEILADELDLTSYFSGSGWKRIRFSSSQLGRINAQLIAKIDLAA